MSATSNFTKLINPLEEKMRESSDCCNKGANRKKALNRKTKFLNIRFQKRVQNS
jgi:hypothetical protein